MGPAIAINPLLYEESSVGESGKTNILVGSGVSVSDDSLLRTVMTTRYDHVDYHYLVNATTSSDMSSYLLETYNDHNHHARFGAYVLDDRIKFSISIDFDELQDDLTGLLEGLNFSETLSTEHPIDWAVSVLDLSTEFYNLTKTSPDMAFNAVSTDVNGSIQLYCSSFSPSLSLPLFSRLIYLHLLTVHYKTCFHHAVGIQIRLYLQTSGYWRWRDWSTLLKRSLCTS